MAVISDEEAKDISDGIKATDLHVKDYGGGSGGYSPHAQSVEVDYSTATPHENHTGLIIGAGVAVITALVVIIVFLLLHQRKYHGKQTHNQ